MTDIAPRPGFSATFSISLALAVGLVSAPASGQTAGPGLTFTKDVAPILQRSCEHCHRTGSIGPMPLVTYEDVRPWADRRPTI